LSILAITVTVENVNVSTDVHVQMNGEFNNREDEDSVFAISAEWFHTWQRFVRGNSEGKLLLFDCADDCEWYL